jgi:tetratricopeptide (TPR) repeat protein
VIPTAALLAVLLAAVPGVAAVQEPPSRAREVYARALELEARGNHAAALTLLWEAAGMAPRDADIQHRLGDALERIGALDAAADAYGRALAVRPSLRKASNSLVLTLVKAGRAPEAVARARAIVAAAPDDPDAHFTLGLAQSEQDVAEAMASFRRALELDPRHALARYNLALVLKREDRLAEAVEQLREAIAIAPRAEAHYSLAVILWHQGELNRAAASLKAAVAADPRYADAHYTLGAVLKMQRDFGGAAAALRRAIALRPDLWGAHYTLAQVLQLAGDERGSAQALREAERLRTRARLEQEAGVWTATGTGRLEQGDVAGAVDHFRRAIGVFEPYAPAHYQLGRALRTLGRGDAARAAFARAHQLNPSLVAPPDVP